MTQKTLDQLIRDGLEIGHSVDQHEVNGFLSELADKYSLEYDYLGYIKYEGSVNKLRLWAKAYYHKDNPIATDEEYDLLYHKVMKFEMQHDIVNEKSPTQFVGWKE